MKLLKCAVCGNLVEVIEEKAGVVTCCDQAMMELKANTSDGALEKHVPVVNVVDGVLHVVVGSMEHPMLPEHYITSIYVEFGNHVYRANLSAGEKPEACFALNDYKGKVHVYEYCNIHGLWKTDIEI